MLVVVWGLCVDGDMLFKAFTLRAVDANQQLVDLLLNKVLALNEQVITLKAQVKVLAQVQSYRACNGELCERVRGKPPGRGGLIN